MLFMFVNFCGDYTFKPGIYNLFIYFKDLCFTFVFFALPSNTKTNFIAEIQLRKHKIKKLQTIQKNF